MTQEEIKKKAEEIAVEHSKIWNDQECGRISTEGECYYSAMEMSKWIVDRMTIHEETVNVPSSACITDDNKLIITADLNALKRYETIKNGIRNNSDIASAQQALNKVRDLANTIEDALAGEKPDPDTYYRMCQEIIECLTKINKII